MGNSEQGCVCIGTRQRIRRNNWKPNFLDSLERLYRKGNKWAESLCGIILGWDTKFDEIFKNPSRWGMFLHKDCDKTALEYQVAPEKKNLFKELEIDFSDIRNPIGALLIQFSQKYTNDYHDLVRDIILKKDLAAASSTLENISLEISLLIQICTNTICEFYIVLNKILQHKTIEIKGILTSQILSGELYRLTFDLSSFLCKDYIVMIKTANDKIPEITIDDKFLSIIRKVSISESPFEKMQYLLLWKAYVDNKNLSGIELDKYVWKHVYESKVKDLFAHLKLVDLFNIDFKENTFDVFLNSLKRCLEF